MRKKAIVCLAIICILLVFNLAYSYAAPIKELQNEGTLRPGGAPDISAVSAVLADSERGQILFEKKAQDKLHIAALCKLMTILIAIESSDLSANITISKDSIDADGSALSLAAGEKYTLEDLAYGIMLTSANDAAVAVAEHVSGDIENFVKKMNETASKLSMKNTNFKNPTGLYDEQQYTTANDIMLFINYAIKNPVFSRIFSTQVRPWNKHDGTTTMLTSQNKLFWSYDGVDGGKVSFNNKDQQTIIATATKGNMKLVCIILDSPEIKLFTDASNVLDYGFDKYKKSILVRKNDVLKKVDISGNKIDLICGDDVYYVHPTGENYIKQFTTTADIQQPISKSKIIGNARYVLNDNTIIDVGLYPASEIIPKQDLYTSIKTKIAENKDIFYLVVFLLAVEAIMILVNLIRLVNRLVKKAAPKNR
jgi:D-alanyl-D-alanine carboxypeptidase